MLKHSKTFLVGLLSAMFLTIFGVLNVAHANPLQFKPSIQTSVSTTTPAYMTAGTATTTLTFDSYATGQPFTTDQAVLLIQFAGSSTASTLNTNLEFSQDGIDWYQDGGTLENAFASTTKPFYLNPVNQYSLAASTSTPAGLGKPGATDATTTRAILVKTPTRFIRAVWSLPIGSAAGAVWGQWIPSRQASS